MYIKKRSIKSYIIVFILILAIYAEITGKFMYIDELLGIYAWIYVSFLLFTNRLRKNDAKVILAIITIILMGVLSNIVYKNVDNITSILVDMISFSKIYIIYILARNIIIDNVRDDVTRMFLPTVKVYSIITFICAVISLFVDIGMAGEIRYGIPSFHFIFPMQHNLTSVTIFAICIILLGMKCKYKKYIFMNCFSIFMTTKGPAIIFCALFLYLNYNFKYKNKIKNWQIAIVGIMILFIGSYQIKTYLMNENAPRTLFIRHSIEIANNNFPLGSGLASFGSPMAAKDYSKLYYQFGFNNLHGLNEVDRSFLLDVGLASIIGQFGWIGFIIYIWILYRIFIYSTYGLFNIKKAFVYSVLIQYLVHSVGSAILNSSAAIIAIIGIAMMSNNRKNELMELKEFNML